MRGARIRTHPPLRTSLLPTLLILSPLLAPAASLDVSVNRDQIYLGESVLLTVKVSDARGASEPDLSALRDCTIESLGSRGESRSSISFINAGIPPASYISRAKYRPAGFRSVRWGVRAAISAKWRIDSSIPTSLAIEGR